MTNPNTSPQTKLNIQEDSSKLIDGAFNGKLSQDEPIKKNVYFYPQENNKNIHSNYSTTKNNIAPQAQPPRQLITPKQQYIKYLVNKINQKKRISQIKSKKMYFV
jgi:hypothetical protein